MPGDPLDDRTVAARSSAGDHRRRRRTSSERPRGRPARNGLPSTAAATSTARSSASSAARRSPSRSRAPAGNVARSSAPGSAASSRPSCTTGTGCRRSARLTARSAEVGTDASRAELARQQRPDVARGPARATSSVGPPTEPGERRAGRHVGVAVGADDQHRPRRHVAGDHASSCTVPSSAQCRSSSTSSTGGRRRPRRGRRAPLRTPRPGPTCGRGVGRGSLPSERSDGRVARPSAEPGEQR